MDAWKQDRIGTADRGENHTTLVRMRSGYAFIGDYQFIPGYCVLVAVPDVNHLSDLPFEKRGEFLLDMSVVGEAVMAVCAPRRINSEILGNTDHYLHAHVWPRYAWEPAAYSGGSVWGYPREQRYAAEYAYSPAQYGDLKARLVSSLFALMKHRGVLP